MVTTNHKGFDPVLMNPRTPNLEVTDPLASNPSSSPETLYHRDDALIYVAYAMHIWGAPIPADRWHCNLWP